MANKTLPHLIGLTGFAGTGKDTVRNFLEDHHDFEGIAFADPMRDMIGALFMQANISTAWMYERALKEQHIEELGPKGGHEISYRLLMQTLGTEWGRSVAPDLWLRIAAARIAALKAKGQKHIVISDVRFANEAAFIKENGGEIWRIHRPSAEPVRPHPSEAEIDSIMHTRWIHNTGSIDELWCQVADVLGGEVVA